MSSFYYETLSKDHLGSVQALADATGAVFESYMYDAWGNVQSAVGNAQSAVGNRYLFQCREYSFASGLYNFRARWYDPQSGRWLSKDPIGLEGGLNLYAFCDDDPVNFLDPWGSRFINKAELIELLKGILNHHKTFQDEIKELVGKYPGLAEALISLGETGLIEITLVSSESTVKLGIIGAAGGGLPFYIAASLTGATAVESGMLLHDMYEGTKKGHEK